MELQPIAPAELAADIPIASVPVRPPSDSRPWALADFASLPALLTAAAFAVLFAKPIYLLGRDWWNLPEAGHGLLLGPIAVYLAWKTGISSESKPNHVAGIVILLLAVFVRCAAGMAAELFTMRASIVMGLAGITTYYFGVRQLLRWWLPFALICLSIPLPELVTQALALPLQFRASRMGAALLEMRQVPVLLSGNVIQLPGRQLFVTEACSGLRSLTALLSTGVLLGALMLRFPISRIIILALAIPVAIFINGIRVFLTGFLVYFVDPKLGEGFMHMTEGWLLFLVSLTILAAAAWVMGMIERRIAPGAVMHA
jgi:exosortase